LNDDNDGMRFANFLKSKQGAVRQHRRVFCETDVPRLSLKVRVEKAKDVKKSQENNKTLINRNNNEENEEPNLTQADQSGRNESPKFVENKQSRSPLKNTPEKVNSVTKSGGVVSDILRRYSFHNRVSHMVRRRLTREFDLTTDSMNFVSIVFNLLMLPNTQIVIFIIEASCE